MTADRVSIMTRSLVARGISVIPVPLRQKKPHISWSEFQRRVPTFEELERWFSRGEQNFAIILGSVSGLVAIDSDSEEAEAWATHHLPPTPMMTRTSKGHHRFYRHPGVPVRNKVKIRAEGGQIALDVRGDGGYVIGPWSQHPSGSLYEPMGDWSIATSELPAFDPRWLPQEEQPPVPPPPPTHSNGGTRSPYERAMAWIEKRDPAVQGQGGDHWTYVTACNLVRDFALSDGEAMAILATWNMRCEPPWTEGDLQKKLASARRTGSHADGEKLLEQREPSRTPRAPGKPTQAQAEEEYFQSLLASPEPPGTPPAPPAQSAPASHPASDGRVVIESALSLMSRVIPKMRWSIVGMLPEGLNILAGRPKSGKSFLSLQIILSVSLGIRFLGRETQIGDVLYLALEDGPRRLQERIKMLLKTNPVPDRLTLAYRWPRWDDGGKDKILEWLKSAKDPRLVVIDTWVKIEPPASKGGDRYNETSSALGALQALALDHNCAILIITHNRKQSRDSMGCDFLDNVIGSTGITGAADAVWGLERDRNQDGEQKTAELKLKGRDFEGFEISLSFADGWCVRSDFEVAQQHPLAKAIIDLVVERGEWCGKTSHLLSDVNDRYEGKFRPWPQDARLFGLQLSKIAPMLWHAGVSLKKTHTDTGTLQEITLRPPQDAQTSSASSGTCMSSGSSILSVEPFLDDNTPRSCQPSLFQYLDSKNGSTDKIDKHDETDETDETDDDACISEDEVII